MKASDTDQLVIRFAELRTIGSNVEIAGLAPEQVHYGESYTTSDEQWARKLQQAAATFTWVAYSFGTIPMWELHVGVVLVAQEARVGFHAHADAEPELLTVLRELGEGFGPASYSEAAKEIQHNEVFTQYGEFDLPRIGRALSQKYIEVRTALEMRNLIERRG